VGVGDSTSAALDFLSAMQPLQIGFVTRLRLDAAGYDPAPPDRGRGRPRQKGKRLPTLAPVLHHPNTVWTTTALSWSAGKRREMQITSAGAVWFHTGKPPVFIRWVLVPDPHGDYDPIALLGTESSADPTSIVSWYLQRWQLEVTFQQARRHLGVETQRQGSEKAIGRTTPVLLGLFSWITLVAHALYTAHPSAAPRQASG
jgi:hypothetical protein